MNAQTRHRSAAHFTRTHTHQLPSAWWHLLLHAVTCYSMLKNSIVGSGKRLTRAKENTYWRRGVGASHFLPHDPKSCTASVLHSPILLSECTIPRSPNPTTFRIFFLSSPVAIPDSPLVPHHPPLLSLRPSLHPHVPFGSCNFPVPSPMGIPWRQD